MKKVLFALLAGMEMVFGICSGAHAWTAEEMLDSPNRYNSSIVAGMDVMSGANPAQYTLNLWAFGPHRPYSHVRAWFNAKKKHPQFLSISFDRDKAAVSGGRQTNVPRFYGILDLRTGVYLITKKAGDQITYTAYALGHLPFWVTLMDQYRAGIYFNPDVQFNMQADDEYTALLPLTDPAFLGALNNQLQEAETAAVYGEALKIANKINAIGGPVFESVTSRYASKLKTKGRKFEKKNFKALTEGGFTLLDEIYEVVVAENAAMEAAIQEIEESESLPALPEFKYPGTETVN